VGDNNPIHGVVGCVPWGEQLVLSVERHCANCECAIALDKQNVTVVTNRPPNWEEMCFVKDLFWDTEEAVMQLHPPKSRWINNHNYCLHLWRPTNQEIPLPPDETVGKKELGELSI
jgi:hypothetical protein